VRGGLSRVKGLQKLFLTLEGVRILLESLELLLIKIYLLHREIIRFLKFGIQRTLLTLR